MRKKKLGIIGGMGSRAGVYFFKKIIDYSPANHDQEFLEIIFHNNSSVPDRTRAIIYSETSPMDSMLRSIELFNTNQVEVIAMSCITAYYYYNQLSAHSNARILNPLHMVADVIRENYRQVERVGILATTGTINTGLFHRELSQTGVEIITLQPDFQEELFMRSVYMKNGFKSATISSEAGRLMGEAVNKLMDRGVNLIVGGCTEVSVAADHVVMPVPYLDTLDILARKTVEYCYG